MILFFKLLTLSLTLKQLKVEILELIRLDLELVLKVLVGEFKLIDLGFELFVLFGRVGEKGLSLVSELFRT